jgi:hypothetical protein
LFFNRLRPGLKKMIDNLLGGGAKLPRVSINNESINKQEKLPIIPIDHFPRCLQRKSSPTARSTATARALIFLF